MYMFLWIYFNTSIAMISTLFLDHMRLFFVVVVSKHIHYDANFSAAASPRKTGEKKSENFLFLRKTHFPYEDDFCVMQSSRSSRFVGWTMPTNWFLSIIFCEGKKKIVSEVRYFWCTNDVKKTKLRQLKSWLARETTCTKKTMTISRLLNSQLNRKRNHFISLEIVSQLLILYERVVWDEMKCWCCWVVDNKMCLVSRFISRCWGK